MRTIGACSDTTSPMIEVSWPSGCSRIRRAGHRPRPAHHDRDQLSFICDIERVQIPVVRRLRAPIPAPECTLLQQHADTRARCDFIQRGCNAAAGWVAHDVNRALAIRTRYSSIALTNELSGAQSLSMPPSNSRFSRWDMIAMPWSPMKPLTSILSPGHARLADILNRSSIHPRQWW